MNILVICRKVLTLESKVSIDYPYMKYLVSKILAAQKLTSPVQSLKQSTILMEAKYQFLYKGRQYVLKSFFG